MRYVFGQCILDPDRRELTRAGATVPLEPQAFDVLRYLVEHRDRVVGRDEILDAVWGTTYVSDSTLATRIKEVRRAVEDDGRTQHTIRTLHRRGYRFVSDVAVEDGPGDAPPSETAVRPERPLPRQRIQFCTVPDGTCLAYAVTGSGPPLVKVANWLSHLEFDLQSPVWRHVVTDLVPDRTLIRYDERGSGLSDWNIDRFGIDAWVGDLEAVVDTLGLERFPLLGMSQGGAVAVAYAAAHPERVSHLVLQGAYARGRNHRGEAGRAEAAALATLARQGWGKGGAFGQMFSARMIPRGTPEQVEWLTELQRVSTSTENAVRFREAFSDVNVEHLMPDVQAPTLVLHSRGDQAAPFEEGRRLAASIRGARFVSLDSDNHLILEDEPAWSVFQREVRAFLAEG